MVIQRKSAIVERDTVVITVVDLPNAPAEAAAFGRPCVEIAGAAPVAITSSEIIGGEIPPGHDDSLLALSVC